MAPEVAKSEGIFFASDVYSFSILLWELVTLEKPFEYIKSLPQFNEEVVRRHERPPLKRVPSLELKTLLSECWDKDPEKRPDFTEVCRVLRELVSQPDAADVPLFKRCGSTSSWRASSVYEDKTDGGVAPETRNAEMATSTAGTLMASRSTNESDAADAERQSPPRFLSFFPWRKKNPELPNSPSPVVEGRRYKERTWIQRKLLGKATMSLDLSTRSFRIRKYDLGSPGSFQSGGSVHSSDEFGRRQSYNSAGSRRSSRNSDSNLEAMAATLAAEAMSNRKFLRELKRDKGEKKERFSGR